MLLFAGFSSSSHPPHPIVRVEEAGWGEGLQNQGGTSPWVPRAQVGPGDGASVRRGISPSGASPTPGAQAEPSRLPPSLSGNGEKTGSGSSLLLPGGRGRGPHCSFPQTSRS